MDHRVLNTMRHKSKPRALALKPWNDDTLELCLCLPKHQRPRNSVLHPLPGSLFQKENRRR